MVKTTLIYIQKGDYFLFLNRNKKENDMNEGKYIGVGGYLEEGETIRDCLYREVKEETGLNLVSDIFLGIIHFKNTDYIDEDIYLFKGSLEEGELFQCNEGTFVWVHKDKILSIPLWEGDKAFLPLLNKNLNGKTFSLTLKYKKDKLVEQSGPFFKSIQDL